MRIYNNMDVFYIGAFPPPYGGVTIKNKNLFRALSERIDIRKLDLRDIKKNPLLVFRLLAILINRSNSFIIGIAGKNNRKAISGILYWINRSSMNKSLLIVMGGTAAKNMASDKVYAKYVREYKKIYVETNGMMRELLNAGIKNVDIYPNGRFRNSSGLFSSTIPRKEVELEHNGFKCVYFSLVSPEKGIDIVLDAAARLDNVWIDVFGEIDNSYKETFFNKIASLNNIEYKGVYSGPENEKYELLHGYDAMLFPTRWRAEGVPGIIIESKIAGIIPIVSMQNYNSELVQNNVDGIVLKENTKDHLVDAINKIKCNKDLLNKLKYNSHKSAEGFYIDNHLDKIIAALNETE